MSEVYIGKSKFTSKLRQNSQLATNWKPITEYHTFNVSKEP